MTTRLSAFTFMLCTSTLTTSSIAGIYLGVQAGGGMLKGDHIYDNPTNTSTNQGATAMRAIGGVYGGHLGYFYSPVGGRAFFFGEALGLTGSAKQQKDLAVTGGTKEGIFSISRKMTLGAAGGGGIFVNPMVGFYVKLGYEQTKFDFSYTQLTYGTQASESFSKKSTGVNFGGGLLYKITNSVFVNGEYTYATGKKIRVRSSDGAINGARRGYSFTPGEHRLMLKLSYMFG